MTLIFNNRRMTQKSWMWAVNLLIILAHPWTEAAPTPWLTKNSDQIDLSYLAALQDISDTRQISTQDYIPLHMNESTDEVYVLGRILDHNFQQWMHSNPNNPLAQKILIDSDVAITSNTHSSSQNLQFKVAGPKASLQYDGPVEAKLDYLAIQNEIHLEVSHKLATNSRVFFSHSGSNMDKQDTLNLQFSW